MVIVPVPDIIHQISLLLVKEDLIAATCDDNFSINELHLPQVSLLSHHIKLKDHRVGSVDRDALALSIDHVHQVSILVEEALYCKIGFVADHLHAADTSPCFFCLKIPDKMVVLLAELVEKSNEKLGVREIALSSSCV